MRIVIVTLGSRGDVEPCLALALGLLQNGHQVTIATHARYHSWIQAHEIGFSPISGSAVTLMDGLVAAGRNGLRYLHHWRGFFLPILQQVMDDIWRACQQADLIVAGTFGQPAFFVAEKLGIGCIRASFQPFDRTRSFPTPMVPQQLHLGEWGNWASHVLVEFIAHQAFRRALNQWRRRYDLAPLEFWSFPYAKLNGRLIPVLYAFSPALVKRPADWGPHIHLTGNWWLPPSPNRTCPDRLKAFLADGPRPVCISFGSMVTNQIEEILDILLAELERLRQRVIVISGWESPSLKNFKENTLLLKPVPHDLVLPQMSLLIHHGGAGTVAAAVRAGLPSLIIPFFGDQPFWGYRVDRLGVGLSINYQRLKKRRIEGTLQRLVKEPEFKKCAEALGGQLRREKGVSSAVKLIEKYGAQ